MAAVVVVLSAMSVFPGSGLQAATYLTGGGAGTNLHAQNGEQGAYPFHGLFTKSAIVLYQRLISPTKGTSCPMTPHCSKYGRMAFDRFNPLVAFMITSDRLHRCSHDLSNYEIVLVDGQLRFSDPLPEGGGSRSADGEGEPEEGSAETPQTVAHSNSDSETGAAMHYANDGDSVLYSFARSLQFSGDYERSITEYQRLLHYYPHTDLKPDASVGLFDAYYMQGDYLSSARWGEEAVTSYLTEDRIPRMKYRIGVSYFRLENYPRSRSYFTDSLVVAHNELRNRGLMLRGMSYAYKMDWRAAIDEFQRVDPESPVSSRADYYEQVCRDAMDVGYKSPTIAGMLSVVPGLGYLYDGYSGTALASFIVNSLFGWATYAAFDKDNDGLGVLLGVLTFGWYSGNIYGSVASAKRKNMDINSQIMMKFNPDEFF